MVGAHREVLGHPFGKPVRELLPLHHLLARHGAARASLELHVVLKLVHHFVRQHVLHFGEVLAKEEHVALVRRVRHAAGAFAQVPRDVVLRKVAARGKKHDWLFLTELIVE